MPEPMTLPGTAETAGMLAIGAVSSGWTSGRAYRFAEQVIAQDLCRTEYDIRNQVIDARLSLQVWQAHYSRVRPHSAGERPVRCRFAWRERWGRYATWHKRGLAAGRLPNVGGRGHVAPDPNEADLVVLGGHANPVEGQNNHKTPGLIAPQPVRDRLRLPAPQFAGVEFRQSLSHPIGELRKSLCLWNF